MLNNSKQQTSLSKPQHRYVPNKFVTPIKMFEKSVLDGRSMGPNGGGSISPTINIQRYKEQQPMEVSLPASLPEISDSRNFAKGRLGG